MQTKPVRSSVHRSRIPSGMRLDGDPILRALYMSSVGFAVYDRACRYQAVNLTLASLHRRSPMAHIGKRARWLTGRVGDLIVPRIERVFATGMPIVGDEVSGKLPMSDSVCHWNRDFLPILDDKGEVVKVCTVVIDVTDRKRLAQDLNECRNNAMRRLTSMMKVSQAAVLGCLRAASSGQPQRSDIERDLRAFRRLAAEYQEMLKEIVGALPFTTNRQGEIKAGDLPERQRTVMRMLGVGESIKEIASSLGISPRTVETHKARLFKRLGFRSLADLTRYAVRAGIVGL